jgi:hypothetical protein
VGNGLSITLLAGVKLALTDLSSTDVAYIEQTNDEIRTYSFTAATPYTDIGTGPTSVKTVSFWVYPKTTTEYFVNLTSTTDYIWASSGTVTVTGFSSPMIYVDGVQTSTLVANKWQHITVTTETAENASNLDIGRTLDADYMRGKIDDVRVYTRALSADEIKRLYKIGATHRVSTTISNDSLIHDIIRTEPTIMHPRLYLHLGWNHLEAWVQGSAVCAVVLANTEFQAVRRETKRAKAKEKPRARCLGALVSRAG